MRIKALILLLLISSAWAQAQQPNPIDQALKAQMGELAFNNTIMVTELKRLTEENTKLKAELETLKKEKENEAGKSK